jgi:glyoxylase-like metal-dependent hydrolase (beta-lactamase superfamily II)
VGGNVNQETEGDRVVVELQPGVWQIRSHKPGSHVYVVLGEFKNVLIDSGIEENFGHLRRHLKEVGIVPEDIDLVINTHEHFDHIGANCFFHETAFIAAHRFAATKIELQDAYVTLIRKKGVDHARKSRVHLWLENRDLIDLGNYKLKILHTPGHTSGCICIYEPFKRFMFTGDTVFAGGTLSEIAPSGSAGDYVNSIERMNTMKVDEFYPGHGAISQSPESDMLQAAENAKKKIREYLDSLP